MPSNVPWPLVSLCSSAVASAVDRGGQNRSETDANAILDLLGVPHTLRPDLLGTLNRLRRTRSGAKCIQMFVRSLTKLQVKF